MLAVIRCKDITTENLSEKIRKYKRLFEEAVKEYQMSQGVLEDSNIPLSKNDKELCDTGCHAGKCCRQ